MSGIYMLTSLIHGFMVSMGLIVAIGAQNAFVLKQGLLKQHIFWVCLTCFLCDFALMVFGVLGFGSLISSSATASMVLAIVGALFLLVYGFRSFKSAIKGDSSLNLDTAKTAPFGKTLATTLALTLLNPHVYLDTVVIIGSVAGTLTSNQKYLFLLGSVSASFLWFFGLGYGARLLIPIFKKPNTWRVLDGIIGLIMWLIAFGLAKFAIGFL